MKTEALSVHMDVLGGKKAPHRVVNQADMFIRKGGLTDVRDLLKQHGLVSGSVKVTVMKTVKYTLESPMFSNVVVNDNFVQVRYKPVGEHYFLLKIVVFKDTNHDTAAIFESLTSINKKVKKTKTETASDDAVEQVVSAVSSLQDDVALFTSIEEFTDACLKEIGPAEHCRLAFWQRQLAAAERKGLVVRTSTSYIVPTDKEEKEDKYTDNVVNVDSMDPYDVLLRSPDLPLILLELVDLSRSRNSLRESIAQQTSKLDQVETQISSLREQIDVNVLKEFVSKLEAE